MSDTYLDAYTQAMSALAAAISARQDNLEAVNTTLGGEVTQLTSDKAALVSANGQLVQDKTALTGQLSTAQQTITTQAGQLTAANGQITTLQGELANASSGGSGLAGTFSLNGDMVAGDVIFTPTPPFDGAALTLTGTPSTKVGVTGSAFVRLAGALLQGSVTSLQVKWSAAGQSDVPFGATFIDRYTTPRPSPFALLAFPYQTLSPDTYHIRGETDYFDVPLGVVRNDGATPYGTNIPYNVRLVNVQGSPLNAADIGVETPSPMMAATQNTRTYVRFDLLGSLFTGSITFNVANPDSNVSTANANSLVLVVDSEEEFPAGYQPRPFELSSTPDVGSFSPPSRAADFFTNFLDAASKIVEYPGSGAYGEFIAKTVDSLNEDTQVDYDHSYALVRPGVTTTVAGVVITADDIMPVQTDADGVQVLTMRAHDCGSKGDNDGIAYHARTKRYASPAFQINGILPLYGFVEFDVDFNLHPALDHAFWRYLFVGQTEDDWIETVDGKLVFTDHDENGQKITSVTTIPVNGRKKFRWYNGQKRRRLWIADKNGQNEVLVMDKPQMFSGISWPFFALNIEGPDGAAHADFPAGTDFTPYYYRPYSLSVWQTDGSEDTHLPTCTTAPTISSPLPRVGVPQTAWVGIWSYGYPATYKWMRDDGPIAGQSGSVLPKPGTFGRTRVSYTPVDGDVGHDVWCEITAQNDDGSGVAETSHVTVVARAAAAQTTSFDVDATALFGRMPSPLSGLYQDAADKLIRALKTAQVWSKLDGFAMAIGPTAAHALIDWRSGRVATLNAGTTAVPTYAEGAGFAFDTHNWIDTGFDPSAAGGVWTADSAALGARVRTGSQRGNIIGATGSYINDGGFAAINGGDAAFENFTQAAGFYVGSRVDPVTTALFRNGVPRVSQDPALTHAAGAATALAAGTVVVGATPGQPQYSPNGTVSGWLYGGSLLRADTKAIQAAVTDYATAVGLA